MLGDVVRFLFVEDNSYIVFINNIIFNVNLENKKEVQELLTKVIKFLDLKYHVSVTGLFEVNIFVNDNIGIFIEFEKINSIISYKDTDLKINIIYNCDFYFKTECFECLKDFQEVYFEDGYYYINVKKLTNLDNYVEFGDVIYRNKFNLERDFIRIK